jgi:ubiquinone/menaquinone biosynthesis C-methylase UbiE
VALAIAGCGSLRAAEEADRIAGLLELAPGMRVADVGAGNGRWAEALAHRVGSSGRVYATEVKEAEIEELRRRFQDFELGNVTVISGDQEDTGLPAGCCHAILLRLVYHHFTEPAKMRLSLRRALQPDGRLMIIDIEPQPGWPDLPGVPDRGGHGIPTEALIAEMASDGFEVAARFGNWQGDPERFCVVFKRRATEDRPEG